MQFVDWIYNEATRTGEIVVADVPPPLDRIVLIDEDATTFAGSLSQPAMRDSLMKMHVERLASMIQRGGGGRR